MNKAEIKALKIGDEVVVKTSLWDGWIPPNPSMEKQDLKARIIEVSKLDDKTLAYTIRFEKYDKELVLHEASVEEHLERSKVKVKTKDKLRGHAFKGVVLKNTTGTKNQGLIDQFQDEEFLLDSFSGLYVYGFPVGHFGDLKYRFQLELTSVHFYSEDQDLKDDIPYIPLQNYICRTADSW